MMGKRKYVAMVLTIHSRSMLVHRGLESVADRAHNFPSRGRLALGAESPWAGVSRGNGRQQVGRNGVFRKVELGVDEERLFEAASLLLFDLRGSGSDGDIARSFDGQIHDIVDGFFFVVPGNLIH